MQNLGEKISSNPINEVHESKKMPVAAKTVTASISQKPTKSLALKSGLKELIQTHKTQSDFFTKFQKRYATSKKKLLEWDQDPRVQTANNLMNTSVSSYYQRSVSPSSTVRHFNFSKDDVAILEILAA